MFSVCFSFFKLSVMMTLQLAGLHCLLFLFLKFGTTRRDCSHFYFISLSIFFSFLSSFLFRDISAPVADIPSHLWQRVRSFRLLWHSTIATVLAVVCHYRTLRHIKAFELGLIFCNKCVYMEWKCVLHCFYGAVVFFFLSSFQWYLSTVCK